MRYNPIVRNFCRIRRILIETLNVPRAAVRPSSTFAELIPREQRRRVWARFRQEQIDASPLSFSCGQIMAILLVKSGFLLACLFVWPWECLPALTAIAIGIGFAFVLRRWADCVDSTYTVGDAALAMTTAEQCQDAEYRLNHKEVFLKVRRILAEVSGLDPNEITPERTFRDLGLE